MLLLVAAVEAVGIASIMPFVAVMTNPEVIQSSEIGRKALSVVGLSEPQHVLIALGALSLFLIVFGNASKALAVWVGLKFENTLYCSLSHRLLATYLSRPYVFFLNRNPSELSKNVLAEVRSVILGVIGPCLSIAANGTVAIAILLLLLIVDPVVALSSVATLSVVYSVIYFYTSRRLGRIGTEQVKANAGKFQAAQEAVSGIKDVKLLGREAHFLDRFRREAELHAVNNVSAGLISSVPRFLLESVAFGGMIALLLVLLASGRPVDTLVPLLALYAFAGYRLLPALQAIYAGMSSLRYSHASLQLLYDDLMDSETSPKASLHDSAAPLPSFSNSIDIVRATFMYPEAQRPSLSGFSVSIAANSTVAFVGPTGSGKTTAVDVILGLLSLVSGELRVDGQLVTEANVRLWQQQVGYVPQTIYLTDSTIRQNIAFGIPDDEIDDALVIQAAEAACLHEFVVSSLPQGYDTVVGDRGVRLSGGQRQRVGIARALYRNPGVLVLDEATSALDRLTEEETMASIRALKGRKTIILIAHRLATVRHADQIVVVDAGEVVAQGTFEQLQQTSRWFRNASSA